MLELNAYLHSQDRKVLLEKRKIRFEEEHRKENKVRKKLHILNGEPESTFQADEFIKADHEEVNYIFVSAKGDKFKKTLSNQS
jgi:hypothetical protein